MNRSVAAAALASISLMLLSDPAPAGSGIGKGAPPASENAPGPLAPLGAAPNSAEPDAATSQTSGGAQQETGAFDNPASEEKTASGTVGEVHRGAMSFTCLCGAGEQTFGTTASTVFRKGNAAANFSDLAPRQSVSIQFHSDGETDVVDAVDIAP
jgi:hypothetical protein